MNKIDFQKWLADKDHLEYSILLEIQDRPLKITLGVQPDDLIEEGQLERFVLTPLNVSSWTFEPTNTEIRLVEINTSNPLIELTFFQSMTSFQLVCEQIEVKKISCIQKSRSLNFNETSVTLSLPPQPLISPHFWLKKLEALNMDCCFRYFGGEAINLKKIKEDYSGYFLIRRSRIKESPRGVFISTSKSNSDSMFLILDCQDPKSYELWIKMITIVSYLKNAQIMIDEQIMDGEFWRQNMEKEYKKKR